MNGNKITLMIIIPTLQCGGAERYVSLLCKYIDKQKFNVAVVVMDNQRPFYDLAETGVEIIDLKQRRIRYGIFPLLALIRERKPRLVLSCANHVNLMLAIFRWRIPPEIKVLARESSTVSANSRRAKSPLIYGSLLKRFYSRLDHILCQSEDMQLDLVRHFNIPLAKTVVIPNPVEPGGPVTAPQKGKLITVARLSEEKGIERLLLALTKIDATFQYHIVGAGPELDKLKQLAASLGLETKVHFEGELKDPFQLFNDADLFLLGSHYEGFPNAALEAQSWGIPVIGFAVPGVKALIDNGINGLLVADNKVQGFAVAIEKGMEMNFDRNAIRELTIRKYGAGQIVSRVEEWIFRSLGD